MDAFCALIWDSETRFWAIGEMEDVGLARLLLTVDGGGEDAGGWEGLCDLWIPACLCSLLRLDT